jgi:hypothetical protein
VLSRHLVRKSSTDEMRVYRFLFGSLICCFLSIGVKRLIGVKHFNKALRMRRFGRAVGIETIHLLEIKEFCGARWPSKVLKGKDGNP